MPIEHSSHATTITGDSISYYQLCVHKHAVEQWQELKRAAVEALARKGIT